MLKKFLKTKLSTLYFFYKYIGCKIYTIFSIKGIFHYYASKHNAIAQQTVSLNMGSQLAFSVRDLSYKEADRENTLLGNNRVNISGGQRQRISVSRELYRGIEILILDEAAIDSETESEIKESIKNLREHITIISIGHRLSTIRTADTLHLMDNGEVVISRSFEDLKNKSPYFKKLTELQGL